jgi:hypothetical protein
LSLTLRLSCMCLLALVACVEPVNVGFNDAGTDGGIGGGTAGGGTPGGGTAGGGTAGGGTPGGGTAGGGTAGGDTAVAGGSACVTTPDLIDLTLLRDGQPYPPMGTQERRVIDTTVSAYAHDAGLHDVTLTEGPTLWELRLRTPFPRPGLLTTGDAVELDVQASLSPFQPVGNLKVILSRAGQVLAFGSQARQQQQVPGLVFETDAGLVARVTGLAPDGCETSIVSCVWRPWSAQVAAPSLSSITLSSGDTGTFGPFEVALEALESTTSMGACDKPGRTEFAAVRR